MSSVFRVQDPKDNTIVIDLREPILTEVELVEMSYPFRRLQIEGSQSEAHPEPSGSPQDKFIQGVREIRGLRRVQIWPYRITLHLAARYSAGEVLEPFVGLVEVCWPGAGWGGYNYLGRNTHGTIVAELTALPTCEELCAHVIDSRLQTTLTGIEPTAPDTPVWIGGFRPASVKRVGDELIFQANRNCFLTRHQGRELRHPIEDLLLHRALLVINDVAGTGKLYRAK
jgi:hypothetical protein